MSVPLRLLCIPGPEDTMAIVIMVCTGPYFLFFCRSLLHPLGRLALLLFFRGFKLVGPMVIMVYRMLAQDIVRFIIN